VAERLEHLQCNVEAALAARLYQEAVALDTAAAERYDQLSEPTADDPELDRDRQVEESLIRQMQENARSLHQQADRTVAEATSIPAGTDPASLEAAVLVPLTDEELAAREELAQSLAWLNLRAERDLLLAGSDWTQLADTPEETRKAWAVYRQQLRDLPADADDDANVIWPEPPGADRDA
jgi:hypothetical protein